MHVPCSLQATWRAGGRWPLVEPFSRTFVLRTSYAGGRCYLYEAIAHVVSSESARVARRWFHHQRLAPISQQQLLQDRGVSNAENSHTANSFDRRSRPEERLIAGPALVGLQAAPRPQPWSWHEPGCSDRYEAVGPASTSIPCPSPALLKQVPPNIGIAFILPPRMYSVLL